MIKVGYTFRYRVGESRFSQTEWQVMLYLASESEAILH